jgi:8-oxo-dGTP pyrophosphatase MutT (NUDIX family)
MQSVCSHKTCKRLFKANIKNVVAALFHKDVNWKMLLVLEKGGKCKDTFNFVAGKINNNECPLKALKREIQEEVKLDVNDWSLFDKIFRNIDGYRIHIVGKTAIFVGHLPLFSLSDVNDAIYKDQKSSKASLREIARAELFDVKTQTCFNTNIPVSKYVFKYTNSSFSLL